MNTIALPDGFLAYDEAGDGGDVVVLLHGGAVDRRMWHPQVGPLAATHRVIALDARGHGRSSTPTEPFRHGDDLAVLLRETGPAHLVGLSMGASTALDTALEHPGLVRSLVISGAGPSEGRPYDPWTVEVQARWARKAAEGDLEGWLDVFGELTVGPHRTASDVAPGVLAQLREMARDTVLRHVVRADGITPPPELLPVERGWERLAELAVPVLAIAGALDAADHVGLTRRTARTAPRGRFVSLDGAAHYPNLERPREWDAVVAEFLSGDQSPGGRATNPS
jgi:pimeloyl-ACP methyl ester carboxylesterase